jgi:renalase
MSASRIAIVGAGLAGLRAARLLTDAGHVVQLFEKSRAPGGRAATRRASYGAFDHGAQYATFRDARTRDLVRAWRDAGVLAPWPARVGIHEQGRTTAPRDATERLVAVPDMRTLGEQMARGLDVLLGRTISAVTRDAGGWWLHEATQPSAGPFDTLLLTAPPPQSAALLATARTHAGGDPVPPPAFHAALAAARTLPCLAALLVLPARPDWPWDAAFVNDDPTLGWIARNASKPGRGEAECWVLHATAAWSAARLEVDPETTLPEFLAAFARVIGETVTHTHATVHRWRYARPADDLASTAEAYFDAALHVGVAGDWCLGGRIEGALLSGAALAQLVQDAGGPVSTGVSA